MILALTALFSIASSKKIPAPFCGQRPAQASTCQLSDHCFISDEICISGLCQPDATIYSDFLCGQYPARAAVKQIAMKTLKHYCGPKTMDIRFCQRSQNCKYSDEYCNQDGICQTAMSLYADNPCGYDLPQVEEVPRKVLKPLCGVFKTQEIRDCDNDFDCFYCDEFCNESDYCETDMSLYADNPCKDE